MDIPEKHPGITHISLHCPDISAAKVALEAAGLRVVATPLSEFMKSGGAAKCLTLRLDTEALDWFGQGAQRGLAAEVHRLTLALGGLVKRGPLFLGERAFEAGAEVLDRLLLNLLAQFLRAGLVGLHHLLELSAIRFLRGRGDLIEERVDDADELALLRSQDDFHLGLELALRLLARLLHRFAFGFGGVGVELHFRSQRLELFICNGFVAGGHQLHFLLVGEL